MKNVHKQSTMKSSRCNHGAKRLNKTRNEDKHCLRQPKSAIYSKVTCSLRWWVCFSWWTTPVRKPDTSCHWPTFSAQQAQEECRKKADSHGFDVTPKHRQFYLLTRTNFLNMWNKITILIIACFKIAKFSLPANNSYHTMRSFDGLHFPIFSTTVACDWWNPFCFPYSDESLYPILISNATLIKYKCGSQ